MLQDAAKQFLDMMVEEEVQWKFHTRLLPILASFPGSQKTLAVVVVDVVVVVLRRMYGKSWRTHDVQNAARVHRLARELC